METEPGPALEILGPDGRRRRVQLHGDRVTIGRFGDVNDIALTPDPQRLVSGRCHCFVELKGRRWRIVDDDSTNGTIVRRGENSCKLRGEELLHDGDVIEIIASFPIGQPPTYWQLTFCHPGQTVPVASACEARLEYDWLQEQAFRITGTNREEITDMRPQVHQLLRCMLNRNRENDNTPVLCRHDELIVEIWPREKALRSHEDLRRLVLELRRCIELDSASPRFLQTVRSFGFRLDPRPSPGRLAP